MNQDPATSLRHRRRPSVLGATVALLLIAGCDKAREPSVTRAPVVMPGNALAPAPLAASDNAGATAPVAAASAVTTPGGTLSVISGEAPLAANPTPAPSPSASAPMSAGLDARLALALVVTRRVAIAPVLLALDAALLARSRGRARGHGLGFGARAHVLLPGETLGG